MSLAAHLTLTIMCLILLAFYHVVFSTVSFKKTSTWLLLLGSFFPYVNLGIVVCLSIIYANWIGRVPVRDNALGRYALIDHQNCDNVLKFVLFCYALVASCLYVLLQILYIF